MTNMGCLLMMLIREGDISRVGNSSRPIGQAKSKTGPDRA